MSVPAAALLSSAIFALCHFRAQTVLPLLLLGTLFSFIFMRTHNLVAPIVLHSLWNVYVLITLIVRP